MIFITGATGSIGSELCQLLAQDTLPARAMCRKEEQMKPLESLGLDPVLADFDHPESVRRGMRGCDKLFLLTSPDHDHTQRERVLIDLALEAGMQHIVRISTADANLSARLSYARSHAEVDHYLRSRPVGWTILRPTGFMQNFVESKHPIGKGILPHMMDEGQISYIDLRDIARVAKRVLTQDGHAGATYFLTGPESLTVAEVAAQLTTELGYAVRALNQSEVDMRKALGYSGMTDWHIDALVEQFIIGANGGEIDVTDEVQRLTGQPARSLVQFVQDYKTHFLNH